MWYVTVARSVVIFVNDSLIAVTAVAWVAVNPVTEPTGLEVAVHVKLAPVTSLCKDALNGSPEQIPSGWLLVRCGVGLTVTVRFEAGPSQLFACGVKWYVTVAGDVVVFVSVSLIEIVLVF